MRRRGLLLLELLAVSRALSHSSSASGRGLGVRVCNVREHGARGDNATEDTAALASALTACEATGGATVVPPGTYLIRPVRLPSGAHLTLQPGATLAAWPDRYTWPNSTDKPCDFDHEGSSCCLKSLPCCVPQKETLSLTPLNQGWRWRTSTFLGRSRTSVVERSRARAAVAARPRAI